MLLLINCNDRALSNNINTSITIKIFAFTFQAMCK